ncbi:MAG: suppressor of fused domain protein [Clostridia bacterium]|nr:suppressor of fused domain protein [Clostridia bacterium]
MNTKLKNKLAKHYDKYFGDKPLILSSATNNDVEVFILLYAPNKIYPFWKIATIGCSDVTQSFKRKRLHNEYVMFVNQNQNLKDDTALRNWYYDMLLVPDAFARDTGKPVFYGADIVFENETCEEMIGVCFLLPQIIPFTKFCFFNLNFFKKISVFQVMPITNIEKEIILNEGISVCEKIFYPNNTMECRPFAEQKRTFDKFKIEDNKK